MDKLEKIFSPMANALQNNKSIQAISKGLMSMMPLIMIGAFASLLQSLPIDVYQQFIQQNGIAAIFGKLVNISTNMLALYAAFAVAYAYTKESGKNDAFAAGLISLGAFFVVTPMSVSGEGWAAVTNLGLEWLGAKGLFSAMIIALIVSKIYKFLNDKNITIKLPDSVPPFVAKSFLSILPAVILIGLFAIITYIFGLTPYGDLHNAIYSLIAAPLNNLGGTVWAGMLIYVLSGLCWFFGIHGIAVVSVMLPIWMAADAVNVAAISAGGAATNIVTYSWLNAVCNIGGAGATLGLVLLCTFFSKSDRYREFGKIALIPSLFNINEPVVFGLPCVLNPLLAVPFIFLPVLLIAIAYVLTITGILPVGNGVGAPAGTPILLAGMFNGGWKLLLWQVVAIGISVCAYFPFFKIMDKQACVEEKRIEKEKSEIA